MQTIWRIKDILEWTTRYFTRKGLEEPRLEAEVLLAGVLQKDRVYLYVNYDRPVNEKERQQYREYIKRRVKGEPNAYILGKKEFMSLDFRVTPDVLIPRPETEILVETALDLAGKQPGIRICDVGTGSGAIAVSLAHYLPETVVYATDISPAALQIAKDNASHLQAEVHFFQGDLLTSLAGGSPFDIICANLPYIGDDEYRCLDSEVRDYEPRQALLAPGDGLGLYRRLIPEAYKLLVPGGHLLMEIAIDQGERLVEMLEGFDKIEIIPDLTGRDRVIKARRGK